MKQRNEKAMLFEYKIKDLLKARGMSQRELARITGLHSPTISNMANGHQSRINARPTGLIMQALDIPMSELVKPVWINEEEETTQD